MLDQLRAVMRGEAPKPPVFEPYTGPDRVLAQIAGSRGPDDKLHYILRTCGERGRDVLVAAPAVLMRVMGQAGLHSYYSTGAPYVLSQILRAADVAVLDRPLVARARGGLVWKRINGVAPEQLVWLLPLADRVELRFRPVSDEAPSRPMPIPEDGPLALPEAWEWSFVPKFVEATSAEGTACPHCGVRAMRHRTAGPDALVCSACGRSFDRS